MMATLGTGILLGFGLAILVGPLVVTIVQASIEEGRPAGFAVGGGIWLSDALFIIAVFFALDYLAAISEHDRFLPILGGIGSVVLIATGAGIFHKTPPRLDFEKADFTPQGVWYWFRTGFLINTVNPFSFFFWISVGTHTALGDASLAETLVFYAGIYFTIVATDTAKVLLAERIRHRLRAKHIWWLRRGSGVVLVAFGLVLLVRSFV